MKTYIVVVVNVILDVKDELANNSWHFLDGVFHLIGRQKHGNSLMCDGNNKEGGHDVSDESEDGSALSIWFLFFV